MSTTTMPARHAANDLIDPVLGKKVWPHAGTGRYYVPQSVTAYLMGRILDIILVAAAAFGLTKATDTLLLSTTIMSPEWAPIAVFGVFLFATVFLYGGAAGTIGTIGEAVARMRIVTIDDGAYAGFLAAGLRAVGWFLYVLFTLMLNGDGNAETRFVAVRTSAGVFPSEPPATLCRKGPQPHTNQA
ncbi:hypothetical protein GCM10023063_14870 [Arthrobacter methylotrophus]|uniref:RDD family protein n=1 Tax=Arthrobacter methylotrophus TaxID=121291 RepID=A0ABV5UNA5_9MICC